MSYFDELTKAMTWLGEQPDTIFIGQNVEYPGNAIYKTLVGVPMTKRIELPVAEEMQMGISLGMALTGKVVISIYPRFDFLLCAMSQLVNHLDKLGGLTHNEYKARVIVRTGVGSTIPLHPGVQHCGDYTEAFKLLLKMPVAELRYTQDIMRTYQYAYTGLGSSLIVEEMDLYGS